jgi:dihydroxy-acid dehydratase
MRPEFDLFDVAEVFKRTPYIAVETGGVMSPKICSRLGRSTLDEDAARSTGSSGDCITVTGRTIAENLKRVKWNKDQDVVTRRQPLSANGGVASGSRERLAPEGAIVSCWDGGLDLPARRAADGEKRASCRRKKNYRKAMCS